MSYLKKLMYFLLRKPAPKTPEEIRHEQFEEFLKIQEEWVDMYRKL